MVSTFPAIDTAVDNIKICEGLEYIAGVMGPRDLDSFCGPTRSGKHPAFTTSISLAHRLRATADGCLPAFGFLGWHKFWGPVNPVMPAFVNIGQRLEGVGEKEELKAFTTAGFFGNEFGPMNLPYPEQAATSVMPPKGMSGATVRQS